MLCPICYEPKMVEEPLSVSSVSAVSACPNVIANVAFDREALCAFSLCRTGW